MKPHKKKRPVRRSFVPSYSSWVRNVQTPLILLIFPLQHIYRDVKQRLIFLSIPERLLLSAVLQPYSCLCIFLPSHASSPFSNLSLSLSHCLFLCNASLCLNLSNIFSLKLCVCNGLSTYFLGKNDPDAFFFTWYQIFKLFDPIILVRTRVMFLS